MTSSISNLKDKALASLGGKWQGAVLITVVYLIICTALSVPSSIHSLPWSIKVPGIVVLLFLTLPLQYGYYATMLKLARDSEGATIESLLSGFKNYVNVLCTMFLMVVYIVLWSLLLIIPGIIKGYSYMMTPYILSDNPQIRAEDAIQESMRMMRGNKMKLFLLDLSFIGWALLCVLTLGIGALWLEPYVYTARAHFYLELKTIQKIAHQNL